MFAETFRNYTRARSDNLYVSVVLLSTVQRFFRTLKKGHKPETFLFFFLKYLTLFDFFFFTEYHLINVWSTGVTHT